VLLYCPRVYQCGRACRGAILPLLRYHASVPRPLNERQSLEQERAEIPGQIAAQRQEVENGRPPKARREELEWKIREREKRLAEG
jgi:hypothetical protein